MARALRDKVILITGASSGIGRATALACAWAGMHVSLAARRTDELKTVAKQVADLNRRAHFFTCNVANRQDVRYLCEEAFHTFGRVDAVFANAGVGLHQPAIDTPLARQHELFNVNYFGTVHLLHEAFAYLSQTKGGLRHMLVCTSSLSEMGPPLKGVYAATKAAQDAYAQALRAEVAAEGFHVTTVHPVGTRTDFAAKADHLAGRDGSHTPKPDWLTQSPELVAKKIVAALRRPRPEVWPSPLARYGAALATAFPSLTARALQRTHDRRSPHPPSDR